MRDPVQVIFKELVSDPEMFYEAINRNVSIGIAAELNPEKFIDPPSGLQKDIEEAEALGDDKLQVVYETTSWTESIVTWGLCLSWKTR